MSKQRQYPAGREDFIPSGAHEMEQNYRLLPLDQYKPGDSFYTQKLIGGHAQVYLCSFQSFTRGLVVGRIVKRSEFADKDQGSVITSKPETCFLIGLAEGDIYARFHWFGKSISVKSPPPRGFLGRPRRRANAR